MNNLLKIPDELFGQTDRKVPNLNVLMLNLGLYHYVDEVFVATDLPDYVLNLIPRFIGRSLGVDCRNVKKVECVVLHIILFPLVDIVRYYFFLELMFFIKNFLLGISSDGPQGFYFLKSFFPPLKA